MKKLVVFMTILGLLSACSKDEDTTPVVADFTAVITGEAPNAVLAIVNTSTGADNYTWTFGEGVSTSTSTEKTPMPLTVDKAGKISITLEAVKGSGKNTKTTEVTVGGVSGIRTFTDIEFALSSGSTTHGNHFSFETGKMYKDTEVTAEVGSKIDLIFGSLSNTMYFFESPNESPLIGANAKHTKVMNYSSSPQLTTEEFALMTNETKLKALSIEDTEDSFGNGQIPGIVLFETASGKKGAIHTKAVNSSRLLVDIKLQKY